MNKKELRFKKRVVFALSIALTLSILFSGVTFLLYGPYSYVRDFIITSAMTTLNHQWIATMLYDEQQIDAVMRENTVIESGETTDIGMIKVNSALWPGKNAKPTIKESEVVYADEDVIVEEFRFSSFKGWMMLVRDPKSVKLGVAKDIGTRGERLQVMTDRLGAFAAINASGFADEGYVGNGGTAVGLVISNGKVINGSISKTQGIIGFDENGILIVGEFARDEIEAMNIRDAVEFRPFLIVNGEPATIKGNGGWGMAPRTAIGQRADGVVLMLVIEGRNPPSSIGATMPEVQDLMIAYGAVNAANLDGGSSSSMILDGEILNVPSSGSGERGVPNGWLVMK
ncbi:MAG: phosphodiester glycosidase family protein [Clostridia bacterium]|nr:phosphodiester glycosidase family protein [Clostridia bacterium]